MDLQEVANRLTEIDKEIAAAVGAVENDGRGSPALRAVVKEFGRKSQEALADLDNADEPLREHIVELEQAGDSAARAAEAEEKIDGDTRRLISAAHADISALKAETVV